MIIANFWWIVGAFAVGYIISGIIYRIGQRKRDDILIAHAAQYTQQAMSSLFIQRLHQLGYDIEEMQERERQLVENGGEPLDFPSGKPTNNDTQIFGFDLTSKKK